MCSRDVFLLVGCKTYTAVWTFYFYMIFKLDFKAVSYDKSLQDILYSIHLYRTYWRETLWGERKTIDRFFDMTEWILCQKKTTCWITDGIHFYPWPCKLLKWSHDWAKVIFVKPNEPFGAKKAFMSPMSLFQPNELF